jgi:hypothetical protein
MALFWTVIAAVIGVFIGAVVILVYPPSVKEY